MSIFKIVLDLISVIISLTSGVKINLGKKDQIEKVPLPDARKVTPLPGTPMNAFHLSLKSKKELLGVHPKLVEVVHRAIMVTDMDFVVFDGKRSAREQARHYKNGVSQLDGYKKKSYHQSGNAVDLVPFVKGRENHGDWDNYYHLAEAMVRAANELGYGGNIRWGAVWDRRLDKLPTTAAKLKKEVGVYARRHPGPDFLDGPHWEWRA